VRDSINNQTQHLVSLAKQGDKSALQRLCEVYAERVLRIVRLRMGAELRSRLQSMDLVQDVFTSALPSLKDFTYKNEGDFLRWLATITENRIRDNLEKFHAGKRNIRREIPLNDTGQAGNDSLATITGPVDSTTPSMKVSRREDLDRLEEAMDKLTPEYRQVILLAKMEGLSGPELAEKLGRSPGAARALLSRALVALSEAYGEGQ
jgi:RNA polymerase sigma-70 factor (ECF subfamily)